MWLLILSLAAHATAIVGVDWVPFGRGDLSWVEDGQLSGTSVAETDGLIHGAITAWGGWRAGANAALFGLSGARIATTTGSDTLDSGSTVAALRPSLDYRRYLGQRAPGQAIAYGQVGAYGVIPAARAWSNAYTTEEQEAMDTTASETRSRIGGWGLRAGGGAQVGFNNGLSVGARYLGVFYRTGSSVDEVKTTSTFLYGEAALVLGFAL